jgi:hypothetical protein
MDPLKPGHATASGSYQEQSPQTSEMGWGLNLGGRITELSVGIRERRAVQTNLPNELVATRGNVDGTAHAMVTT